MSDIPEDLLKAAWLVVGDIDADFTHDSQTSGNREMKDAQEAIARALLAERMAERERCAKIALDFTPVGKLVHLGTRQGISLAIRNQDKP